MLRNVALGWDTANITAELGVSAHIVRNHSKNLRSKLNVGSSPEVVTFAVRMECRSSAIMGQQRG